MESAIFNIFLEALKQVFSETGIEIEDVEPIQDNSPPDQVVTSVGITGRVRGNLMLFTDFPSAVNIIKCMMGRVRIPFPQEGLGEIQKTALGEITNQISGRAVTILSERSLECNITPPFVITAKKLTSRVPGLVESVSRSVKGPFGSLRLFLALSPLKKTS